MLEGLVQLQFCSGQEALGTGGTGVGLGGSVEFDQVALQVLLLHELLGAGGALVGHLPRVGHHVHPQLHPPAEGLLAHGAREDLFRAVHAVPGFVLQEVLLPKVALSTLGTFKGFLPSVFPVVDF